MTTIIGKYIGLSHPLGDMKLDEDKHDLVLEAWKRTNCLKGYHLFDEVLSATETDNHYLHCDACGIEVHIKKIVVPDGKDDIIE